MCAVVKMIREESLWTFWREKASSCEGKASMACRGLWRGGQPSNNHRVAGGGWLALETHFEMLAACS